MTDSTPTFRPATPADAPAVVEFQLAMAWETEQLRLDAGTVTRGVAAVFERPGLGTYFVAEVGGQVVAALLITHEWSDWRDGVIWWVQSVYVRPEFRRRGVFRGLFEFVRSRAVVGAGVAGLRLYAETENEAAHAVYRSLGMVGGRYEVFEWMRDEQRERRE